MHGQNHIKLVLVVSKNTKKARTGMIFIQNIVHLEVIRQNPRTVQLAMLWAGNRRLVVLHWQGQDFCICSIPVSSGAHLASYQRGTVEGGLFPASKEALA